MNTPRILIVDDEAEILLLYKTKFERSGFTVLTAKNGQEAIDTATVEKPDLTIMDVKMPLVDGITAQKMIHANPETKDLKFVFLTAFSDPTAHSIDITLGAETGILGVIRKGEDLNQLVAAVRGFLGITEPTS